MRQEVIAASEQKHTMLETAAHSVRQIKCQQGSYRRRLADATVEGVFLWCKECRRAHLVTWDALFLLREEFRPVLVSVEQVS